ncbi:MAG: hypothetical protein EG825_05690 [Rhodocyclaceae bacterium]|nr:hypothetical protein [Rhodocyclaceae bacterium]
MKKLLSLLAASLLLGCVSVADAGHTVDVAVINRSTGERLQTWRYEGRLYVAGRPGDRYAVELNNRSGGRILTVLSVDGVNAISGQTAAASQSGYVLDPGQRSEIAGWRKSMDEVAAFYFTALSDSYAARTGRPDNVGVIGVAVYREYVEPRVDYEVQSLSKSAPAAPMAMPQGAGANRDEATRAQPMEKRLGTGHGERIAAPTQSTEFRRASSRPSEVIAIYYDSHANLVARGIIPAPHRPAQPQPFPGGFVPDPRG